MIIHFWQLPKKRTYIILKEKFKRRVIKVLDKKKYPWKTKNKIINGKISIQKINPIAKKEKIPLLEIEKSIIWIGGNRSKGLSHPKFPISFNTREGSRFIAAIINDGCLTKKEEKGYGRLMYDNFDSSIRESVISDYLKIFGGKKEEIAFRNSEKKKYLEFSSVIRDITELVIKDKGAKCESNILLPLFILKNKEAMTGWIEQTIADEGEVKHYPTKNYADKYRRAIVWRRSLDVSSLFNKRIEKDTPLRRLPQEIQEALQKQECNLINSEEKILRLLGIEYTLYNLGIYPTVKHKVRTRWQISITKRENLLKLRNLIKIPSNSKDEKFTEMMGGFIRYKELLEVKEAIKKIGKRKNSFTSIDLKKKMNYKETNTAIKWLKIFENRGLLKKIRESSYGGGKYRQPAAYSLIQDK